MYLGPECNTNCSMGMYGDNCNLKNNCSNNGSYVENLNSCICPRGWIGDNCNVSCEPGTYGFNCTDKCPEKHIDGKTSFGCCVRLGVHYIGDVW